MTRIGIGDKDSDMKLETFKTPVRDTCLLSALQENFPRTLNIFFFSFIC